jgi:hypothetical protein
MARLVFTASIIEIHKGHYVAHSPVFPVLAGSAGTQRGAIEKLRDAILLHLRDGTKRGVLVTVLEEAGYPADLIGLEHVALHPIIFDTVDVSLPLTRRMVRLNRTKRQTTGEERNSDAA